MKGKNIIGKGNESLAMGAMLAIGAAAHPCPTCLLGSAAFLANAVREKLSD
jgi:hypothetical protein